MGFFENLKKDFSQAVNDLLQKDGFIDDLEEELSDLEEFETEESPVDEEVNNLFAENKPMEEMAREDKTKDFVQANLLEQVVEETSPALEEIFLETNTKPEEILKEELKIVELLREEPGILQEEEAKTEIIEEDFIISEKKEEISENISNEEAVEEIFKIEELEDITLKQEESSGEDTEIEQLEESSKETRKEEQSEEFFKGKTEVEQPKETSKKNMEVEKLEKQSKKNIEVKKLEEPSQKNSKIVEYPSKLSQKNSKIVEKTKGLSQRNTKTTKSKKKVQTAVLEALTEEEMDTIEKLLTESTLLGNDKKEKLEDEKMARLETKGANNMDDMDFIAEVLNEEEENTSDIIDDEVTIIAKGTKVVGNISSDSSLEIDGTVTGDIECLGRLSVKGYVAGNSSASEIYVNTSRLDGNLISEGIVKIEAGTVVIGDIEATSAVIAGAVKGEIDINGPITIDSTAIIKGNIKAKSIQINNGAVIDGHCALAYAAVDIDSYFGKGTATEGKTVVTESVKGNEGKKAAENK